MKVIARTTIAEGRWSILREARFVDNHGQEKTWTYVERRNGQSAVVIVPVTEETGRILLIRQIRIPFDRVVVEFPAGLIDPGESAEETAHRELREETGHTGRIIAISPPVSTSAGISTEVVTMVYMRVSERPAAPQELEGTERIDVFTLGREECGEYLRRATAEGLLFDAKTYTYLAMIAGEMAAR